MNYNLFCNGKRLCSVFVADSFKDRLLGYMFRKNPHYEAILFKPCSSIHTFFMKFDIDVLFLDDNMKVLKKHEGVKRGRIIYEKGSAIVIETKSGGFKNIGVGNKIDIEFL